MKVKSKCSTCNTYFELDEDSDWTVEGTKVLCAKCNKEAADD